MSCAHSTKLYKTRQQLYYDDDDDDDDYNYYYYYYYRVTQYKTIYIYLYKQK